MALVVGLGNPGDEYHGTRHNVGFAVVDRIAQRAGISWSSPPFRRYLFCETDRDLLVKPLTYMNLSGEVVPPLLRRHTGSRLLRNESDLIVICDNLDLPPGRIRVKRGGGTAGHRGIESIVAALGAGSFVRVYVGIGHPGNAAQVVGYVLQKPSPEESEQMNDAIERGADAVVTCTKFGVDRAMNRYNRSTG